MDMLNDHAIAGAISGFATRLICQPLDVIKIRLQLQVEPVSHNYPSKYRSLLHTTFTIVKEEGILALWKGHVPAQLLSISYGMAQFYTYKKMMDLMPNVPQHSAHFVAGATCGCVATVVSFPFDTARTRLVAQSSGHQIYSGLYSCYMSILKTESVKTLFYGLSPTLLQIVPFTGLQFMFYHLFANIYKAFIIEDSQQQDKYKSEISPTNSMISGSIAGVLAKTAIYPLDLARKRLQIQGFKHGRAGFGKFFQCNGLIDCLRRTVQEENIAGLFKGIVPSQVKAAATSALHFTFYEQTLILLKYLKV